MNLSVIISKLSTMYENGEDCIHPVTGELVTDNEYDALVAQFVADGGDPNGFKTSTSKIRKKMTHDKPMTSIDKCNGTEEEKIEILEAWIKKCGIGKFADIVVSRKLDGVALSIEYRNGKLYQAGLRSRDGKCGEDVTENVKRFVKTELPLPYNITLRGEVVLAKNHFVKLNERLEKMKLKTKANPRNHVAGAIKKSYKDDFDFYTKAGELNFIAYELISESNLFTSDITAMTIDTEISKMNFVKDVLEMSYVTLLECTSMDDLLQKLNVLELTHRDFTYLMDGAVLAINNLAKQKSLGFHGDKDTNNPRYKLAYKFKDEVRTTVVESVDWQVGRTGELTPVLNVRTIELEGTQVSKCTAHNYGYFIENATDTGAEIELVKSGKIIPKVKSVIKPSEYVVIPEKCPVCGGRVAIDKIHLVCCNENCQAQQENKLYHYLSSLGCKGIGRKIINKMINNGVISGDNISELYELGLEDLAGVFTLRQATLIIARLYMLPDPEKEKDNQKLANDFRPFLEGDKIEIQFDKFFAGLGITGAGKSLGKDLMNHFATNGGFAALRKASANQLMQLDNIGELTADYISDYFISNSDEIDTILEHIQLVRPVVIESSEISGKTFCFTGGFPEGKKYWQNEVEKQGGIIKSSISKRLDFVIVGSNSGSKSKKAVQYGLEMLDREDLIDLLGL